MGVWIHFCPKSKAKVGPLQWLEGLETPSAEAKACPIPLCGSRIALNLPQVASL